MANLSTVCFSLFSEHKLKHRNVFDGDVFPEIKLQLTHYSAHMLVPGEPTLLDLGREWPERVPVPGAILGVRGSEADVGKCSKL